MKTILVKKLTAALVLLTVLCAGANNGAAQTASKGVVIKGKALILTVTKQRSALCGL